MCCACFLRGLFVGYHSRAHLCFDTLFTEIAILIMTLNLHLLGPILVEKTCPFWSPFLVEKTCPFWSPFLVEMSKAILAKKKTGTCNFDLMKKMEFA